MNKQEKLAKLSKTIKLFKTLKLVGLAVMILGAVLFAASMVLYVINLVDAMNSANQELVAAVYLEFIFYGSSTMFIAAVGLAALIVFSILGKKKRAAYLVLEKSDEEAA